MLQKQYLVTAGPTPVPPAVLAAMARPIVHHRGPDFRRTIASLGERLKQVFRSDSEVVILTAAGTGGMEAAVANLCSPGDRVLVASAGYFGERWAALAQAYGCELEHLRYAWGETPTAAEIQARVEELGGVQAVFFTHSETSTGVVTDAEAIAAAVRASGALVAVDAISSLGALPLESDAWGFDVVVSGSQKALMTPPGLALTATSARARERAATASSPRFYLDWQRAASYGNTPAVSLMVGLDVALGLLLEQGLEAAFEHHRRLGRACRAGVKALGLELFSPDEDRAAVVTAARTPAGVDSAEIVLAMRERSGVTVVGGQGELKGKIVRIGHIGYVDVFDIAVALDALEDALAEAGVAVERGAAAATALQSYHASAR